MSGPKVRQRGWRRIEGLGAVAVAAACLLIGSELRAQGPQVDVENPPGSPHARVRLGQPLGASGTSGFDATPVTSQQSIFGGRPGPSASRAPINQLAAPQPPVMRIQALNRPGALQ